MGGGRGEIPPLNFRQDYNYFCVKTTVNVISTGINYSSIRLFVSLNTSKISSKGTLLSSGPSTAIFINTDRLQSDRRFLNLYKFDSKMALESTLEYVKLKNFLGGGHAPRPL